MLAGMAFQLLVILSSRLPILTLTGTVHLLDYWQYCVCTRAAIPLAFLIEFEFTENAQNVGVFRY